jgi:hypothetical protein
MYMTTAHSQIRPCGATGTQLSIDPAYFQIVDDNMSNGTFIDAYNCTGPDPSTCDQNGFPFVSLAQKTADGQFLAESASRSGAGTCLVDWTGDWIRKTSAGVTVTHESRTGEWTGAMCDGDITDAEVVTARTLACDSDEEWLGTATR